MLKRFINWVAGVKEPEIEDPNAYDLYPDIIADLSLDEITRRIGVNDANLADDEDSTANFWMEMNEDV
jgi:hypothetical protein